MISLLEKLVVEQTLIGQKLALTQVNFNISPSEACKTSNKPQYNGLLEELRISVQHSCGSDGDANAWTFSWGQKNETDSYKDVCDFLNISFATIGAVVGNGQNCSDGKLFNEVVHSLRNRPNVHGEGVVAKFTIAGRPDIISVKKVQEEYRRFHVVEAYEIKTVKQMAEKAKECECEREAILQAIGLNVGNVSTSPPVILTNLNQKHKVIFIEPESDTSLLAYVVHVVSFKVLAAAISFVRTQLLDSETGYRTCVTKDFGRHCSPLASVCDDNNNGDMLDSVQVDEIDPLDDFLPNSDF